MWIVQCCAMGLCKAVLVFSFIFIYSITPAHLQSTNKTFTCPPNQYYDHGTRTCERCSEICDTARHTGSEDYCREVCPAYANIKMPPVAPPAPEITERPKDTPSSSAGNHSPIIWPALGIAVPAAAVLIISSLSILLYKKREYVLKRCRRRPSDEESAIELSQQAQQLLPDALPVGEARAPSGVQEEDEQTASVNERLSDLIAGTASHHVSGLPEAPSPGSGPSDTGVSSPKPFIKALDNGVLYSMLATSTTLYNEPSGPGSASATEEHHSTDPKTSDFSQSS